eukprot:SAG11_NODE_413_length_9694_cov_2.695675_2_plen_650_part_00
MPRGRPKGTTRKPGAKKVTGWRQYDKKGRQGGETGQSGGQGKSAKRAATLSSVLAAAPRSEHDSHAPSRTATRKTRPIESGQVVACADAASAPRLSAARLSNKDAFVFVNTAWRQLGSPSDPFEWDGENGVAALIVRAMAKICFTIDPRTVKHHLCQCVEDSKQQACTFAAPTRQSARLSAKELGNYLKSPALAQKIRNSLSPVTFERLETAAARLHEKTEKSAVLARMYKSRKNTAKDVATVAMTAARLARSATTGVAQVKDNRGHVTIEARDTVVDLLTRHNVSGAQSFETVETMCTKFFGKAAANGKEKVKNTTEQVRHCMAERSELLVLDQVVRLWEGVAGARAPPASVYVPSDDCWASTGLIPRLARIEAKGSVEPGGCADAEWRLGHDDEQYRPLYNEMVVTNYQAFLGDVGFDSACPTYVPPTAIASPDDELNDDSSSGGNAASCSDDGGESVKRSVVVNKTQPSLNPLTHKSWPCNIGCGGLHAGVDSTSHERQAREETVINIGGYPGAQDHAELGKLAELFDGRSGPRSELREILRLLSDIRDRQRLRGLDRRYHLYLYDIPVWVFDNCNGNRGEKNGLFVIVITRVIVNHKLCALVVNIPSFPHSTCGIRGIFVPGKLVILVGHESAEQLDIEWLLHWL